MVNSTQFLSPRTYDISSLSTQYILSIIIRLNINISHNYCADGAHKPADPRNLSEKSRKALKKSLSSDK